MSKPSPVTVLVKVIVFHSDQCFIFNVKLCAYLLEFLTFQTNFLVILASGELC